ncbi:MAG: hypothetical protein ACI8QC_000692 [Planctomycetota bacterium]|jgi:hypothetical protein
MSAPVESGVANSDPNSQRELDPLVALLMPAVIHRLGNATQLLTGLNAMLAMGDQDALDMVAGRGEDLSRAGMHSTHMGYALGVLGSVQGDDLLLSRREPRGLEWMVELLGEALRREGGQLGAPQSPLPDQDPAALDGWQAAWAVCRILLAGASDGSSDQSWSLQQAGPGGPWLLDVPRPHADDMEQLAMAFERQTCGLRLGTGSETRATFELPADWFRQA